MLHCVVDEVVITAVVYIIAGVVAKVGVTLVTVPSVVDEVVVTPVLLIVAADEGKAVVTLVILLVPKVEVV